MKKETKEILKVKVENFGPLAEASVGLRPLTVFIGPKNAGKSYLATLIYAIFRIAEDSLLTLGIGRREFVKSPFRIPRGIALREPSALLKWLKKRMESSEEIKEISFKEAPQEVKEELRNFTEDIVKSLFVDGLKEEVERCFGTSFESLLRRSQKAESLNINLSFRRFWLNISYAVKKDLEPSFSIKVERIEKLSLKPSPEFHLIFDVLQLTDRGLLFLVKENLGDFLFPDYPLNVFYFPVARSGILQAHRQLARITVREAFRVGIRELTVLPFSGVVADFISLLLELPDIITGIPPEIGEFQADADFLEKEILKGRIDVKPVRERILLYPEIRYIQAGLELPVYRTSSAISELAPLDILLRYPLLNKGDLLIIEEPEAHLHPEGQLLIARLFARLIRKGLRILITTHSDFLLEEINNLIRASRLKEEERAEVAGYEKDEFLKPQEVGAFLFKFDEEKEGFVTEELKISQKEGIEEEEFLKIAEAMNTRRSKLYRALQR